VFSIKIISSVAVVVSAVMLVGFADSDSPPSGVRSSNVPDSSEFKAAWLLLDRLHHAASIAKADEYFDCFAPDAVFLGTDATERWKLEDFKAYAKQRFVEGKGWTYTLVTGTRHVSMTNDESIAWFDELLDNAKYGRCRGSGVLRKIGEQWKIAQYNLTFTIPNATAEEVVALIKAKPN
jgi:hypothetical protein